MGAKGKKGHFPCVSKRSQKGFCGQMSVTNTFYLSSPTTALAHLNTCELIQASEENLW